MRSTAIGTFTVAMVGCALASAGSEARADNAIPASNGAGMDTHLFRPAMDSKGFFTVNGTEVLGANQTSFGLIIDYGNDLLRVPYKGQSSNQLIIASTMPSVDPPILCRILPITLENNLPIGPSCWSVSNRA